MRLFLLEIVVWLSNSVELIWIGLIWIESIWIGFIWIYIFELNWICFWSWYGWRISSPQNIWEALLFSITLVTSFLWVLTVCPAPRHLSSVNLTLRIQLKHLRKKPCCLSCPTAQKCWALILLHFFGKNSQQFDCAVYFWGPPLPPKWRQIATRLHYFSYKLYG